MSLFTEADILRQLLFWRACFPSFKIPFFLTYNIPFYIHSCWQFHIFRSFKSYFTTFESVWWFCNVVGLKKSKMAASRLRPFENYGMTYFAHHILLWPCCHLYVPGNDKGNILGCTIYLQALLSFKTLGFTEEGGFRPLSLSQKTINVRLV